jgi:hypothetical protein
MICSIDDKFVFHHCSRDLFHRLNFYSLCSLHLFRNQNFIPVLVMICSIDDKFVFHHCNRDLFCGLNFCSHVVSICFVAQFIVPCASKIGSMFIQMICSFGAIIFCFGMTSDAIFLLLF